MKSYLYKMECLTNLHVGSGNINFTIVDNEVEKDPATNYPMINATGIKGAIKDFCSGKDFVAKVFGEKGNETEVNSGDFKFFDAHFLYRPMRTQGSVPSVPVSTVTAINSFISTISAFNCNPFGVEKIEEPDFKGNQFLVNTDKIESVEGDKTAKYTNDEIKKILTVDEFALANSFDNYDLPVIARNQLDSKTKTSNNLWYEEFVPHGSAFYLIVLTPDTYDKKDMLDVIPDGGIIQFGGNASVGCGFCRMSLIGEGEC